MSLEIWHVKDLAQERAFLGASYLDKKMPGWSKKINPDRLNMGHPNSCIGGQLQGSYTAFYELLGYGADEERDLGFAYSFREFGGGNAQARRLYYELLTKAWKVVLCVHEEVY